MRLTILHTNDFHGALTPERADFIANLKEAGSLYFDCGDCIRTGNLGIPLRPESAWRLLSRARCDASTLGNRETHILESAFRRKLEGANQPIVVSNLKYRTSGSSPEFVTRAVRFEMAGVRVGVAGVMVPMVTARMKTAAASAFLWDPPIEAARQMASELRDAADILILLSHIGHQRDLVLAREVPSYDLILGGHSHTVVSTPEIVGRTLVMQAGSHGRYVGRYELKQGSGAWTVRSHELIPLP